MVRTSYCVLSIAGSVALQSLLDVLEESCRYFKTADGRWAACVSRLGLRWEGGRGKSQFCVGTNNFHCHLGRSGPRGGGPTACLNILELWNVWELWGCSDMHETITVAALLWPSRPSLSSAGHVWLSATVPRFPSTCYIHR